MRRNATITALTTFVLAVTTTTPTLAADIPYVDDGMLYQQEAASSAPPVPVGILATRILDQNRTNNIILVLENDPNQDDPHLVSGALHRVDTTTWNAAKVADGIMSAKLSPRGNAAVVWRDDDTVDMVNLDGDVLANIGIHGAAPIYSHSGNLISYQKLADVSDDGSRQTLFELAQGIAIYDLRTQQERLVTFDPEDFAPAGFSRNEKKLYFNSTRAYEDAPQSHVASVWVVDLESGKTERLTNRSSKLVRQGTVVPIIDADALWTTDRGTAISSTDSESGVWIYNFSPSGITVSASHLADGGTPQWTKRDEIFAAKVLIEGKPSWRTHHIQANNRNGEGQ